MSNLLGTHPRFIWYDLMTSDANAAVRFYGDVVGWEISGQPDPDTSGMDYRMIVRDDGGNAGGVLQLNQDVLSHGAKSTWVAYLDVPDVDAAVKVIISDGGRLLMPKMTLPVGDIALVSDPMNSPLYVMRPVPPSVQSDAVSDVFSVDKPQHVRWNELCSPDLDRAMAFYARHFDFSFEDHMPMGSSLGNYHFIDQGDLRIGGMMAHVGNSDHFGWTFYFGVRSAMAALRAIEAGGGKVETEMHQVPGGDWALIARDPQGARFGLVGPKGE